MWGRSVFDNIRKFLQFQLTVNVVALTLTFVSAVTGYSPPLNAVMMLWVNLIMDTMGALALGTEPPSTDLLSRLPYKRDSSLISRIMIKNILIQSVFQIALLAYILIIGSNDFDTIEGSKEHFTVVFNVFVFCQIFNEFNARSITNDPNIFQGLSKNIVFLAISLFTIVTQYTLVTYGGDFVKTTPLTHDQWIKSILLAALTFPVGGLMRLIPIAESKDDFAVVPKVMKEIKRQDSTLTNNLVKKSSGISILVWYFVVTVVPVLVWDKFGSLWKGHLISNGFMAN